MHTRHDFYHVPSQFPLYRKYIISWKAKIRWRFGKDITYTVKCHYNACHYNTNASLTRSTFGSQTAPTSWHALMTIPEWLSTWAKGVKSSRSDRPQRQWHLFVPIQLEQNKRIPLAGHVNTVDSWLIFDQTLIIHLRCSENATIQPIWLLHPRMLKTIPVAIKLT